MIRRPTRRDPAGSTVPSSSADATTTRRGTTSSATAIRPTPPSSTTAAAPRTPTLPDAPPTSTAPTTMPTTPRSSSIQHSLLFINLSVTSSHLIHHPCLITTVITCLACPVTKISTSGLTASIIPWPVCTALYCQSISNNNANKVLKPLCLDWIEPTAI